jgi:hypothetical protein
MIKRYVNFINEAEDTSNVEGVKPMANNSDIYGEMKDEVKKMIDGTISNSGGEFATFVESFIKNPDDVKVEKFINDSDIYDFYLKFRNDIDEILNNVKFFSENPAELNAYGLYEYVIIGTEKAFMEVVKMIK